jgi:hypothetical protein
VRSGNRSKNNRENPIWLRGHGGDTTEEHQANTRRIVDYLTRLRSSGGALPASLLSPTTLSISLVAEESGVKLVSITRGKSRYRKMVEAAQDGLDGHPKIPVAVRMKARVRPVYTIFEMIRIATAVIQAECEHAEAKHGDRCALVESLLKRVASGMSGLNHDSGDAIQAALAGEDHQPEEKATLREIDAIRIKATQGELELQSFHGRLKLEAALRGFGVGAIANFTSAATQTVINWGSGLKSPTRMFKNDIPKIEKALELPPGYLADAHVCHRSGPSNVKRYHMPPEVRDMSAIMQKEFRRFVDPTINLRELPMSEVDALMQKTLQIFHKSRDNDDVRRAKLQHDMPYALPELPRHLQDEFDSLVKQRKSILLMGIVKNKKRGWDKDTVDIYQQRFRLFCGWLHHCMGIPLDHLSLAYLAFPQVLNEYMLHLVERKVDVGLELGFSAVAREWYVFAGSLTRDKFEVKSGSKASYDFDSDEDERIDSGTPAGWLRDKCHLLDRVAPIDIPRRRDELDLAAEIRNDVRMVLTAHHIQKARKHWPARLDDTTVKYRGWRKEHSGNETNADTVGRIAEILRWPDPFDAIEFGVQRIRSVIERMTKRNPEKPFRWATAVRASVTLKLHAQIPLRRTTFCALTYRADNKGMIRKEDGRWWVVVPANIFKNEKSKAFKALTKDGLFRQEIMDQWGLHADLALYVELARSKILGDAASDAFYVAQGNPGHVSPETFGGEFRLITRNYIAGNPGTGEGLPGVRDFGSHAMRHIVATAIWKRTKDEHAAAAAIHDSVEMTRKHYKTIIDSSERRAAVIDEALAASAKGRPWPKYREMLPKIDSPPSVPFDPSIGIHSRVGDAELREGATSNDEGERA